MGKMTRKPTHPGTFLKLEVLPDLGLPISKVAAEIGVSRQILHRILSERAPVTAEMALRLGTYLGKGPELWLNMQNNYDLWHAQRKLGRELEHIWRAKNERELHA